MTVRQEINAKKRFLMQISHIGFGTFAVGCGLSLINPELGILGLLGFVVAFLTNVYAYTFAFRCPNCRAYWGILAHQSGSLSFEVDHRLKCCPYCGVDLDSELVATKPTDDPDWNA